MTDIAQNIIAKANLTRGSSLPELLLCEQEMLLKGDLTKAKQKTGSGVLEDILSVDMFLYAQILASNDIKDNKQYFSAEQLLEQISHDSLKAKLRQATAQISFGRASKLRLRFLKQLYLQSVLTRNLAEQLAINVLPETPNKALLIQQAGFCGLFLNIGALVLEQVFTGKYLEMLSKASSVEDLLADEKREFGIDHADLGAELLKSWGIDGFCCDALQYHHLDISQVLDATPLVKITWLANQFSDEKSYLEAPLWADSLFDVRDASLVQIRESADSKVRASLQTLNITYSTMRYLPLPETEEAGVLKEEIKAFKQLRKKAEADNLFTLAKESLQTANGASELGQAIGSVTRLLFGPCESLLFIRPGNDQPLSCLAGTLNKNELSQISIRCEAERSVIAQCFVNDESIFALPEENLPVIDRQLLSMLGTDNLCCEPIHSPDSPEPCGVLVLGINSNKTDSFKEQVYLRNDLGLELGKILLRSQDALGAGSEVVTHYNNLIRETIHEANNPLGIIKNYLQLLSLKQGEDTKIQSEISFMKSEIDRVSNILEKLKDKPDYSKIDKNIKPAIKISTVDINSVISKLVNIFSGSFAASENININLDLDLSLSKIESQEDAIRQIITNLVKNAAEAIKDGGTILVKTAGNLYMNGEHYIQLIVKDDGPGISTHILNTLSAFSKNNGSESIKNSSNSTKGDGHIGSGLCVVQKLVSELGGMISCQTTRIENHTPNTVNASGTEITILLPASTSSPEVSQGINNSEDAH